MPHKTQHAACRLCGDRLPLRPIAVLSHAPAGAQALPDAAGLRGDTAVPLAIHECGSCGLVQNGGRPVRYFRDVITAAGLSPEMIEYRRDQFAAWAAHYDLAGARVLEVGSGRGEMLPLLAAAGLRPTGLEHAVMPEHHELFPDITIVHGYPTQRAAVLGAPFSAFVCLNFLEHAPDPRPFLRGIRRSVEDGAPGLVEVPSLEHVLESRRSYDWVRDHCSYFSDETLRLALELSGFSVDSVERSWKGYNLTAHVRRRAPSGAGGLEPDLREITRSLNTWLTARTRGHASVAVWGASHQALTLLAEAGAGNRVSYVVDSAPFKQGRWTPVTHVPIVSPSALTAQPVDAVLVMAAGYTDEVIRSLRADGFLGQVFVVSGERIVSA